MTKQKPNDTADRSAAQRANEADARQDTTTDAKAAADTNDANPNPPGTAPDTADAQRGPTAHVAPVQHDPAASTAVPPAAEQANCADRMKAVEDRVATVSDELTEKVEDLKKWLQSEVGQLRDALQERHEGYLKEFGRDQETIIGEDAEAAAKRAAERPAHIEDRLERLESGFARIEKSVGALKHFT